MQLVAALVLASHHTRWAVIFSRVWCDVGVPLQLISGGGVGQAPCRTEHVGMNTVQHKELCAARTVAAWTKIWIDKC